MSELPVGLNLHDLDTTIGILFEGYVLTMILYGFIVFDVHSYFERYGRDSLGWKSTIAILFCVDSTTLAFLTAALHEYMITQFPLIGVSVNAATKYAFLYYMAVDYIERLIRDFRVDTGCAASHRNSTSAPRNLIPSEHRLPLFLSCNSVMSSESGHVPGNNRVIAAVILAVATAAFVLGVVATAQMISHPLFNSFFRHPFKVINSCCQGLTSLAAGLTFYVLSHSRPDSSKGTFFQHVHEYLLIWGGGATILQLGHFITFLATPSKRYWMIFSLVTRRVFILSILAMLNSRSAVNGGNQPPGTSSNTARGTEMSDMSFANPSPKASKYQNTLDLEISRAGEDDMNDSGDPEDHEESIKGSSLTAAAI
ncbi:hypothetical protein MVEN_01581200 [Mycena venus]|uniref:Uncharacterized protein n=1 Tax=Mycena venus TaxID=2733690 RepID=A0A8H6XSP6_9AGAR|nr:hypothetical protein MVEN_01581200 [Mycena venus]